MRAHHDARPGPAPPPAPRRASRVRDAVPHSNPAQTDRSRAVPPPGEWDRTDPFLLMAEDGFSRTGFDWHPHRGFETITYVVEGRLEHRDNAGGQGVLDAGDLQWTTTGSGVRHAEKAYERKPVRTLQLGLNLPAAVKMTPPRYQDLRAADAPLVREPGVEARLFAGTRGGLVGPARTLWPAGVLAARMQRGARFAHEVPGDHAVLLYVIEGSVRAGEDARPVREGQSAWFDAGPAGASVIEVVAEAASHVIAYGARPIPAP